MDKTDTAAPTGNPGAKSKRLALKITVQDKTRAIEFTDNELPDPIKPEAKKAEKEVKPVFDSKVLPPPPKLIGSTSTKPLKWRSGGSLPTFGSPNPEL